MSWEDKIFCGRELVPAIITDCENGEVLMLAYMNRESFKKTLETGKTWFFRVRETLSGTKAKRADTGSMLNR